MPRQNIRRLYEQLNIYLNLEEAIEPLLFLLAKITSESDSEYKVKDIRLHSTSDLRNMKELLNKFADAVLRYLDADYNFSDIDDTDQNGELWHKIMENDEIDLLINLQDLIDTSSDFSDFLKNKFYRRTFVVEIQLDESNSQKILLFKQIKGTKYNAKKKFFVFTPFETQQHIKILNNQRDIILDDKFEIAAFIDKDNQSNSFFFIINRNLFEDIFNYREKYQGAYENLTQNLNFIDWSGCEESTPLLRQSYSLSRFPELNQCVQQIKTNLLAEDDNITKRALVSKNISYEVNNDEVKINPDGTQQLRALLKIIKDGLATTFILGREGITGDFEQI